MGYLGIPTSVAYCCLRVKPPSFLHERTAPRAWGYGHRYELSDVYHGHGNRKAEREAEHLAQFPGSIAAEYLKLSGGHPNRFPVMLKIVSDRLKDVSPSVSVLIFLGRSTRSAAVFPQTTIWTHVARLKNNSATADPPINYQN